MADQFHFHPESYLELVRAEVPDYELLQHTVADAGAEVQASRILDLGTGTGETLRRVAARHPNAELVGVDESEGMLDAARSAVPAADLRVARLQDPLPDGPFDLVVSALAVHHLGPSEKTELFRRVGQRLSRGGRFVLADVVVPDDPADAITPLDPGYDVPSRVDEQLQWLRDADLSPAVRWRRRDLAVIVADRDVTAHRDG
jgi:tRNA (cmo5U34)-methyltransferase